MALFYSLLMWLYKQHAKRVRGAQFSLCLLLLSPEMLLQPTTGNANIPLLWRVMATVRVKASVTHRVTHGATAASPFIAAITLHWNQRLSGNACSLSNGCTGSEETENCGTYAPHCCWNNWTHTAISWVGWFLSTFEVQVYASRDLLVNCWILAELCSRWLCHFIM